MITVVGVGWGGREDASRQHLVQRHVPTMVGWRRHHGKARRDDLLHWGAVRVDVLNTGRWGHVLGVRVGSNGRVTMAVHLSTTTTIVAGVSVVGGVGVGGQRGDISGGDNASLVTG